MEDKRAETVRIDLTGALDRAGIEALRLEVLHLARQYGVDVTEFRIEQTVDG